MPNLLTIKESIFTLEVCEAQEYKCYFAKIKKASEVVWIEEFKEKEVAIRIGKLMFSRIIDTYKYLGNKIDKPYTLDEHKRFIREMNKGKVSIEKFRANFERAVVSLKKDLEKLTKKQLLRRCRFIPVHWDIVNEAYEVCLGRFAPNGVILVKVYVDEDFVSAVRRQVYDTKFV